MNDYDKVLADAKRKWEREQRARDRGGFFQRLVNSVPWWVIIIAIGFYMLSAPHTVAVFDMIVPGWGWVAPLPIEAGLLYLAFRRKLSEKAHIPIPRTDRWLMHLLFLTAILANGAGGLVAAVKSANIASLSIGSLLQGLSELPLTSQAALALALIAAFIIPIGASVAGEGLANLVFERHVTGEHLDGLWACDRAEVEYRALYNFLLSHEGLTAAKAADQAARYFKYVNIPENGGKAGNGGMAIDKPKLAKGEARQRLDELFRDDPSIVRLPVEELIELTGAGKSAIYDWRGSKRNGHSHE